MKLKLRIILIIAVLLSQVSCTKWMDLQPPQGLIREEFWHSKEDVETVLMGAYDTFRGLNGNLFKYGEMRADMVTWDVNLSQDERKIMEGNIYSDNSMCGWSGFYQVINYCNEVITNAPKVQKEDDTFTEYQLQGYLSEAYFLRSMAYFYLVRIFKDVPYITQPTETDDANFYPEKTNGDTILNRVEKDLEEHYQYATVNGYLTIAENKGRATKASIDALIADIALWQFDYEKVIKRVENIERSVKYVLLKSGRWFDLFYPGNSNESIFEFQFNDALNQGNGLFGLTQQNAHNYVPSETAVNMFSRLTAKGGEIYRGEDASIAMITKGEYIIWKYVGMRPDGESVRPSTIQNSANWIVYRYAGVLLMKAEALSQLGRYSEALSIINEIRDRADVPALNIPNSATAYEDAILHERALELSFEGKRWFDLLRMGRRNNYSRKAQLIQILVSNVPSTQKRILATKLTNPLGWYLPIAKSEMERNKNLVQNPYYNNF